MRTHLSMMSLVYVMVVIALHLVFGKPTLWARDIYFMASAISNFTHEFGDLRCNRIGVAPNYTYACMVGNLRCRIMVANINPTSAPQQVQIILDHVQLRPLGGTTFNMAGGDPFFTGGTTHLTYQAQVASAVDNNWSIAWKISTNLPTADATSFLLDGTTGTVNLAANEAVIYERSLGIRPLSSNVRSAATGGGVKTSFTDVHPHMKMYHVCSGRIRVTDSGTTPGFVVASGHLEYYANSYQNPTINYGGFVHSPNAEVHLSPALSLRTWVDSATSAYHHSDGGGGAESWGYGRCQFTGQNTSECVVSPRFNNLFQSNGTPNFSSSRPINVSSVPIIINGGSPF